MSMVRSITSSLRREEWDFSKVLEHEVNACLDWECAREWKPVANEMEQWKNLSPREKERNEIDSHTNLSIARMLEGITSYLDTPWVLLPEEIRRDALFWADTPLAQVIDPQPIDFDSDKRRGKKFQRVFCFELDWSSPDSRLMAEFANWLTYHRKQKPVERRGSNPRDRLKMIGAMRLLHHMTLEDAVAVTRKALGKPLYGKRPSWDRARRGAVDAIVEIVVYDPAALADAQDTELISSYAKKKRVGEQLAEK